MSACAKVGKVEGGEEEAKVEGGEEMGKVEGGEEEAKVRRRRWSGRWSGGEEGQVGALGVPVAGERIGCEQEV